MERQPSNVIIYKRGDAYYCNVQGHFGGGFTGAFAGRTAEDAGLFALTQKARYIDNNPMGGNMYLPSEVREAIEVSKV